MKSVVEKWFFKTSEERDEAVKKINSKYIEVFVTSTPVLGKPGIIVSTVSSINFRIAVNDYISSIGGLSAASM